MRESELVVLSLEEGKGRTLITSLTIRSWKMSLCLEESLLGLDQVERLEVGLIELSIKGMT